MRKSSGQKGCPRQSARAGERGCHAGSAFAPRPRPSPPPSLPPPCPLAPALTPSELSSALPLCIANHYPHPSTHHPRKPQRQVPLDGGVAWQDLAVWCGMSRLPPPGSGRGTRSSGSRSRWRARQPQLQALGVLPCHCRAALCRDVFGHVNYQQQRQWRHAGRHLLDRLLQRAQQLLRLFGRPVWPGR